MKIKKAVVKNFRNFKDETAINLSNYNVFIGVNGSGKSNMGRIIFDLAKAYPNTVVNLVPFLGKHGKDSTVNLEIELEKEDIEFLCDSQQTDSLKANENTGPALSDFCKKNSVYVKRDHKLSGSKIQFSISDSGSNVDSYSEFENQMHNLVVSEIGSRITFVPDTRDLPSSFDFSHLDRDGPIDMRNFVIFLTDLKLNYRSSYELLMQLTRKVLLNAKEVVITPSGMGQNRTQRAEIGLLDDNSDYIVPAIEISKGSRELLVLLSMLIISKPHSSIFIEEPEIHLHPSATRVLKEIILDLGRKKDLQITLITHNPQFLSDLYPENDPGVRFYEFIRESDGSTEVKEIRSDSDIADAVNALTFS